MSNIKRLQDLPEIDFTKKVLSSLRVEFIVKKPGCPDQTNCAIFYFDEFLIYRLEDTNFNNLFINTHKAINNLMSNNSLNHISTLKDSKVYYLGDEHRIVYWNPDLGTIFLVPSEYYNTEYEEYNVFSLDFLDDSIKWA